MNVKKMGKRMNMENWFVITLINNKIDLYHILNLIRVFNFDFFPFSNLLMNDQMVLIYSVENQLYRSMNLCCLNYLGIVVWKRFLTVHQMLQAIQQKTLNFI